MVFLQALKQDNKKNFVQMYTCVHISIVASVFQLHCPKPNGNSPVSLLVCTDNSTENMSKEAADDIHCSTLKIAAQKGKPYTCSAVCDEIQMSWTL